MNEMQPKRIYNFRNGPSLFFPVLLITVGTLWLLIINGNASVGNVYRLLPYWPVLLIGVGVAVILRQISWVLSGLFWLAAGAVVIWFVVSPPAYLPGTSEPNFTQKQFSEPVGGAKSAQVVLNLSFLPSDVKTVEERNDLFTADVSYVGSLNYEASGSGTEKSIHLGEQSSNLIFNWPMTMYETQDRSWKIGLNPRIPFDLDVKAGMGQATLDLKQLQLTSLDIEGGLGSMQVLLPEDSAPYHFDLQISGGSVTVEAPYGSTFDMEVAGGAGSVNIDVPEDSGIQITVRDSSLGSLKLPGGYEKVKQGDEDDEGVWENSAFSKDETPIRIFLNMSVGGVTIQ